MGEVTASLGKFVYIDANIIVYAVEGYARHERAIKAILAAMDQGRLTVATSELTLAEVLVKPKQNRNASLEEAYRRFLEPSRALFLAPVTRDILIAAADVRATTSLKLPDAIHVATAAELGCETFLTNDRSLAAAETMRVAILAEAQIV